MDVNGLLSSTGTTGTSSATAAGEQFSETYETFLKLLTTQLRYQDPLEPLDTHEFTNQLVQFSNVEQSIATNKRLEELIGFQQKNQAVAALGYIGQTVEAVSDKLALKSGEATAVYALAGDADAVAMTIKDASGETIRTVPLEKSAGKHTYVWDGKDSAGNAMPDGAYAFSVAGVDADGGAIDTATGIIARVSSVESGTDGVVLNFNGVLVALERVLSVKSADPPAADS